MLLLGYRCPEVPLRFLLKERMPLSEALRVSDAVATLVPDVTLPQDQSGLRLVLLVRNLFDYFGQFGWFSNQANREFSDVFLGGDSK